MGLPIEVAVLAREVFRAVNLGPESFERFDKLILI
jgi:hypothetical protein